MSNLRFTGDLLSQMVFRPVLRRTSLEGIGSTSSRTDGKHVDEAAEPLFQAVAGPGPRARAAAGRVRRPARVGARRAAAAPRPALRGPLRRPFLNVLPLAVWPSRRGREQAYGLRRQQRRHPGGRRPDGRSSTASEGARAAALRPTAPPGSSGSVHPRPQQLLLTALAAEYRSVGIDSFRQQRGPRLPAADRRARPHTQGRRGAPRRPPEARHRAPEGTGAAARAAAEAGVRRDPAGRDQGALSPGQAGPRAAGSSGRQGRDRPGQRMGRAGQLGGRLERPTRGNLFTPGGSYAEV